MKFKYTEDQLVDAYKMLNPKSRIISILKYHKNSARIKQKICVICKRTGPTWCAEYRQTKRAFEWEEKHIETHLGKVK